MALLSPLSSLIKGQKSAAPSASPAKRNLGPLFAFTDAATLLAFGLKAPISKIQLFILADVKAIFGCYFGDSDIHFSENRIW